MEDLVVSDVQHDIVERQRAKLQHHLSYLVRGMQVQTGRRALDDFEIREFEGKVHWQNIVSVSTFVRIGLFFRCTVAER